ncbi:uncharacterized protein C5L36_0B12790 [Pichia kudriavzevii]|uniref:CFEM domain-containing protein n=1 Tax=Pichia kudriavzevii TaxID=4909 RepID=A0A2U9R3Y6_PICKU|nr:uncharacterized protein C5L36_0B12790 [Pichia kudriavzevii]AWU76052.1 hypothetical protein C5L36_0B12790 [Pichia kudriavzevii]
MLSYVSIAVILAAYVAPSVATPPACLLACAAEVIKASSQCNQLNEINCVCSNEASSIQSCLQSKCPNGNADTAYTSFKNVCKEQGVDVNGNSSSAKPSSSSSSAKPSSSSSAQPSTTSSSSSSFSSAEPSSSVTPTTFEEPTTSVAPTTSEEPTSSVAPTTSAEPTSSVAPTTSAEPSSTIVTSTSAEPVPTYDPSISSGNFAAALQYNGLLGAAALAVVNLI